MKNEVSISQSRLFEVLNYDPNEGIFRWKVKIASNTKINAVAGNVQKSGYRYLKIDKKDYLAQRLAWLWVHGEWPKKILRFQNENRDDFRIDNLREGFKLSTKFDHNTPEGRAAYGKQFRMEKPDHYRKWFLKSRFGITVEAYDKMFSEQNGLCAICGKSEEKMKSGKPTFIGVDHNHKTGAVRGLLCRRCNSMLAYAYDDVGYLQKGIAYLEKHEK